MQKQHKCYLCDNNKLEKVQGKVRDNNRLVIYKCPNCSLVFLDSMEHISDEFYQSGEMHNDSLTPQTWADCTKTDDLRRFSFLKEDIENKLLVDFGCGSGGFLSLANNICQKTFGIELDNNQRNYLNSQGLCVYKTINELPETVDFITMFHVLEHIKDPITLLKELKTKLKNNNSQIIIEVPNSDDALISLYKSKAFLNFTWWSCHLYTYNKKSLTKLVEKSGYKVNYIKNIQRYNWLNHTYWLTNGKPGGHEKLKHFNCKLIEKIYNTFLSSINKTDTILISISSR